MLQLTFWRGVPDHITVEKAPNLPIFKRQAHILKCRYNNTRILLYRPFLFYSCSTLGGKYPVPDSLRLNFARQSARVCLNCAVDQVEQVLLQIDDEMQGHYWLVWLFCIVEHGPELISLFLLIPRRFNLGHLYSSALVLLAHRLVNFKWPEEQKEEIERLTSASLRKVIHYLVVR
jgi:hypothetical protein